VDGTDLGTVTRAMEKIHRPNETNLPRGSHFTLRGQSETMYKSYFGLLAGLAISILLVYLLIVVNFQSWLDPFLIISALPMRRWQVLSGFCFSPIQGSVCRR
jgi:multidrug efflux pump subunit AcrB